MVRKKSIPGSKEKVLKLVVSGLLWQRVKDSNPHIQSQSLLCYLYTNPLICSFMSHEQVLYTGKQEFVKGFFEKNNICRFQPFQGIFPGKPPLRVHHQKQISLFRK